MDWRRFAQQGFLTVALVVGAAVIVSMILPNLDFRGAMVLIAVVALLFGAVL